MIKGENGRIPNRKATINVQSAGTAARFMTVFLAVAGGDYTLQSSEQMKKRPMSELLGSLTAKGVEIKCLEEEGHFPFEIRELSQVILKSTRLPAVSMPAHCLWHL